MDENKIIFVVGCERSGSTLLRLMLSSHPQIHILADGPYQTFIDKCIKSEKGITYIYEPFTRFGLLKERETINLINAAIPLTEKIRQILDKKQKKVSKPYIGLQIHKYYTILKNAFPNAKYIHLIRDPRPVCKSMIAMGWYGNYYCAAKYWADSINNIRKLQKELQEKNFLEVKYEDMVSKPKELLGLICSFIGVKYTDEIFDYTKHSTYSHPDGKNINSWRYAIKKKDICYVEAIAREPMEYYKYGFLCSHVRPPSCFKKLYLQMDNKMKTIFFKMRYFGFKDYIMIKINHYLRRKVFIEAEKHILEKQIHALK